MILRGLSLLCLLARLITSLPLLCFVLLIKAGTTALCSGGKGPGTRKFPQVAGLVAAHKTMVEDSSEVPFYLFPASSEVLGNTGLYLFFRTLLRRHF